MNIISLHTSNEINMILSNRIRSIRKNRKLSQENLAARSGVSLGSLKRFESSGQISLLSFTKLVMALGLERELEDLFSTPQFTSIDEVIRGQGK